MIVLYQKHNNEFVSMISGLPELEESDNKLYLKGGKVIINNLSRIGYKEYPDQSVGLVEGADELDVIPPTLEQLNLRNFTAEELEEKEKGSLIDRIRELEKDVKDLKEKK